MKNIIYLSFYLFLVFASCGPKDTHNGDEREVALEILTITYEDLIEGKKELEKALIELQQEMEKSSTEMPAEYDSLIHSVEEKIQTMEVKAIEYKAAVEEQKGKLLKDYELLEKEARERMDHIKAVFEVKN